MKYLQFPNIRDINWLELKFILIISYLILKKKFTLLLGREIGKVKIFFGILISKLGDKKKLFVSKIRMIFDYLLKIIIVIKNKSLIGRDFLIKLGSKIKKLIIKIGEKFDYLCEDISGSKMTLLLAGYSIVYKISKNTISKSNLIILKWCFRKILCLLEKSICNNKVENYSFTTTKHKLTILIYTLISNCLILIFANACPWKEGLNKNLIMSIILNNIFIIKIVGFYFLKNLLLNKNFSLKDFTLGLGFDILFKIILGIITKIIKDNLVYLIIKIIEIYLSF